MTPHEVWDQCPYKELSFDEVFPEMPRRDEYLYNELPDRLQVESLGRGGCGSPARLTQRDGSKLTEEEWMAAYKCHLETGIVPPVILSGSPEWELSPLQRSALEKALIAAGVRQHWENAVRCAVALRLRHPNWAKKAVNIKAGKLRGWPNLADEREGEYGAPRRCAACVNKVLKLTNAYIGEAKVRKPVEKT